MDNSLFFCNVDRNSRIGDFISKLEEYSKKNSKQIYIIKKALGTDEGKYNCDYDLAVTVLIPKHKIIVLNYGADDNEDFLEFYDECVDVLGYLAKNFEYNQIIGRRRQWEESCIACMNYSEYMNNIDMFLNDIRINVSDERKVDLLISLLIGSINDINKVGKDIPETLLDKVKHKIVLFDGMQSRFIYEKVDNDLIKIQGLAGTGKTELLLHKLRETYVNEKESRVVFTCHNKVLAEDMRNRIPKFFNFMKVQEQIEWDKRLWVFSSWGSQSSRNSGMYSYICNFYNLEFRRYSYNNSFDNVCKLALEELKAREEVSKCFDYVFIDESQDFSENFVELCRFVTSRKVYLAGDIFQNIFDNKVNEAVNCDYLLNKCYRTDPRTLMFAHSVGMGLYEVPVIRWLEDIGWKSCGYEYERNTCQEMILTRTPIRRFEDLESAGISSITLKDTSEDMITQRILECIEEIRKNNTTVKAEDIAVIFTSNTKVNYKIADELVYLLDEKYNWDSCRGYITKTKINNAVFISNTNNVKGLEFPFVICVETGRITRDINQRNSIYMILTRSFLNSYFIVNSINTDFIEIYKGAIESINKNGFLKLREPNEEEKKKQAENVRIAANAQRKSVEDMINEVCIKYPQLTNEQKHDLYQFIPKHIKDKVLDEQKIKDKTEKMIALMISED